MRTITETVDDVVRAEEPLPPMPYRWNGEAFEALHPKRADRYLVIGETYWLERHEPRSMVSHAHEFAWLAEAWRNLPETLADAYPTAEHLRKRALIQAGYHHETVIDVGSKAAALRVAAAVQSFEPFAYVIVRESYVVVRRAESQSMRAMGKQRFQESKTAILDVVSQMIGVAPETLKTNAGRSA